MKITRLIPILSFAIFLSPVFALAAELSDCDEGTISCQCIPETEIDSEKIQELDDCDNYCTIETINNDEITGYSLQCKIDGVVTTLDQDSVSTVEEALKESVYADPELSVEIPGLEFSPAIVNGQVAESSYLGEYIQAVYNWLIPAASLLAVIMIMIGGLQWMLARGDSGKIGNAKTRLKNAVTGLILLLAAYSITYVIDPNLLTYDSLKLSYIDPIAYVNNSGDSPGSINIGTPPTEVVCDSSYSVTDIAGSLIGHVAYRLGGKGGPPPYPSETKVDSSGRPYSEYCPDDNICLDCSGFVGYVAQCAGLASAGESGGTAGIFTSSAELVTSCSSDGTVNGTPLNPGSLLGWSADMTDEHSSGHVFMYIGEGTVIDSSGGGREPGEAVNPKSISFACDSYEGYLHVVRR